MLLSRIGQKKQRPWPWFKPPAAGPTVRYSGWYWDPAEGEWVEDKVGPIKIVYVSQLYPKPTQLPSREFSSSQPGWGYDFTTYKWVKTYVEAEPIEFVPPRTLPPDINLASVFPADPYFAKDLEIALRLVEMGAWDTLQGGNAFQQLVYQVHKVCPDAKFPVSIAEGVFEARYVMHAKKTWLASKEAWQMRVNAMDPSKLGLVGPAIALAIIGIVAALTGFLIGTIMERLTFPEEETFTLSEPTGTYLLRYDHYLYGKMIGISPKGKPFYSACDDIGTSYIRHRKAPTKGGVDIIDFPGGFVEEGHKGAYFVKYTWRAWTLEYVGFLTSVGGNFYVLREGNTDSYAWGKAPFMLHESEWCPDFRWYL